MGHRLRRVGRNIADADASLPRRGAVDVVETRATFADKLYGRRETQDQLARERHLLVDDLNS